MLLWTDIDGTPPLLVGGTYFDEVLADNPHIYWRFNSGLTHGERMPDASGLDRQGHIYAYGPAGNSSQNGIANGDYAWRFGGINGTFSQLYIGYGQDYGDPLNAATEAYLAHNYTIETWVKLESWGHDSLKFQSPVANMNVNAITQRVEASYWEPSGFASAHQLSHDVELDTWYHFVYRVSQQVPGQGKHQLWVNNVKVDSEDNLTLTLNNSTGVNNVHLAGQDGYVDEQTKAFIDEIAFYPSYLSESRIAAHYGAAVL